MHDGAHITGVAAIDSTLRWIVGVANERNNEKNDSRIDFGWTDLHRALDDLRGQAARLGETWQSFEQDKAPKPSFQGELAPQPEAAAQNQTTKAEQGHHDQGSSPLCYPLQQGNSPKPQSRLQHKASFQGELAPQPEAAAQNQTTKAEQGHHDQGSSLLCYPLQQGNRPKPRSQPRPLPISNTNSNDNISSLRSRSSAYSTNTNTRATTCPQLPPPAKDESDQRLRYPPDSAEVRNRGAVMGTPLHGPIARLAHWARLSPVSRIPLSSYRQCR